MLAAAAAIAPLHGYTRLRTDFGTFQFRANPANIQFLVNNQTQAGLLNTDGNLTITADSDPLTAIERAMTTWTALPQSTISFQAPVVTAVSPNGADGQDSITFEDTASNRQVVGDAIAVTVVFSTPSGSVTEADVYLNPAKLDGGGAPQPFSTTGAAGTFDIESTVLHELGHALGMEHTNVFGALLWPFGRTGDDHGRDLKADDIAFATDLYPNNGVQPQFGRIRGTATLNGGGPVSSGMVVAVDGATGVVVSGQTDLSTGGYNILVPPGDYFVYIESLSGQVLPSNLDLTPAEVTAPFPATRPVGAAAGQTLPVTAGGEAVADFLVSVGNPALGIATTGIDSSGGGQAVVFGDGPHVLPAGTADLYLWGPGLQSVAEADLRVLAPNVTVVPGSLTFNTQFPVDSFPGALQFSVVVDAIPGPRPAFEGRPLGTVVIEKGGLTAAAPGGLVLDLPVSPGTPDNLGIFTDGVWYLDLNGDRIYAPMTEVKGWGSPGDIPVVGDWNGDGSDSMGVYSGGEWYIDINSNTTFEPATEAKGWGLSGWTPLPGAWR